MLTFRKLFSDKNKYLYFFWKNSFANKEGALLDEAEGGQIWCIIIKNSFADRNTGGSAE